MADTRLACPILEYASAWSALSRRA